MIFLSHNYKDKPVIEQVALRLRDIYGQNNVFYDSWSIQPGDGIIDKMNEGLTNCKFFFFFISQNSLNSSMVKLEWQNALFKAAQNRIQFIPIRMDNSIMPALLTQSLYIDLFSQGLEIAIRQMVDVINGNNTYREPKYQFSNLIAYKYKEGNKIIIECHAEHFLEPISSFAFCTQHDANTIQAEAKNTIARMAGQQNDVRLQNGYKTNILFRSISKATVPNFPFVVEFSTRDNTSFDIEAVMHQTSQEEYHPIPLINGRRPNKA